MEFFCRFIYFCLLVSSIKWLHWNWLLQLKLGRSLKGPAILLSHYPGSSELSPWFHGRKTSWNYAQTYHQGKPTLCLTIEKCDAYSQELIGTSGASGCSWPVHMTPEGSEGRNSIIDEMWTGCSVTAAAKEDAEAIKESNPGSTTNHCGENTRHPWHWIHCN